jgi:hypothetical protein
MGFIENLSYQNNHSIPLNGLTNGTTYHYRVVSTDQAGFVATSSDATFILTDGPVFNIWYGLNQTFGQIGVPQQWVNILGNVSDPDGFSQFTYSLNGGPDQPLNIGPERRLEKPGDFNVDIDFAELLDGTNSITITAVDTLGNSTIEKVMVNYPSGNIWPINYSIDWNVASQLQNVAQVVDGLWTIADGNLMPSIVGYDRAVAIGDISWSDYEVEIPVTIHSIDFKGFERPNGEPAVGVLLKWPGHTDWTGDQQPNWGYFPGGGGAWYEINADGSGDLRLTDFDGLAASDPLNRSLDFDLTYIWKVRVETLQNGNSQYSIKVWESSLPEPPTWELVDIDADDVAGGSLLLVAHYTDVSFGNIVIQPIN